jgi:SAM-dependent methyltransferase
MIIIPRIKNKIAQRRKLLRFKKDFLQFSNMSKHDNRQLSLLWGDTRTIYEDTEKTQFDTHYIYHPAWAARILAKTKPEFHVDISSKLDFSTLVSAFIPIKFYDFRPANIILNNLTSSKIDILNLPFDDMSITSISCMHVIEHIGLGRYGDEIDSDGDIKAMQELSRVLAKDGQLLFVVPVGKPKIQFNAHRIYSYKQILEYFKDLTLKEFSLIPDNAQERGIVLNASKDEADKQTYGCGCFLFTKD